MPMPTLRTPEQFNAQLNEILEHTKVGAVLVIASQLEESLEKAIAYQLPNLSKTLRARLFSGYGPLASFSAKIDMAYAMAEINSATHRDLHTVRKIRNAFAHSRTEITFRSPEVAKSVSKLSNYVANSDADGVFLDVTFDCTSEIFRSIERGALAFALQQDGSTPDDVVE